MCSGGCWGINQFGGDVGKIASGKGGGTQWVPPYPCCLLLSPDRDACLCHLLALFGVLQEQRLAGGCTCAQVRGTQSHLSASPAQFNGGVPSLEESSL